MLKTEAGPIAGASKRSRPWYTVLHPQVLIAIDVGVLLGYFYLKTATALKPLGDAFIALIKMMIAPVIFCTVVHDIASMTNLAKVGRVGLKALVYFEIVSTVALAIGLLLGEIPKPGRASTSIRPRSIRTRWRRT
jgi:aerobic C4-dicarboxylate transport protein